MSSGAMLQTSEMPAQTVPIQTVPTPTVPLSLFETPPAEAPQHGHYVPPPLSPEQESLIVLPHREYVPRVLEERWYQTQALGEIALRFHSKGRRNNKGELLVAPTGTGKTSIASRAIGDWLERRERVLILVDLERLLTQMEDDLAEEGIYPLIEQADKSALYDFLTNKGRCVLASMQTLYTKRLQTWARDAFDKIVIDEAHELRWLPIADYFKSAQLLGLTATPFATKGKSLKKYFNYPYIRTLTLREAIEGWNAITQQYEKPFLSRILVEDIPAQHIDISNIKVVGEGKGQDFDQSEVDRAIWEHTNWLASTILEKAGDRPTWIYCPRIHTAEAIAEALRDMGASAACYTSNTPDPQGMMQRFERGELQFLTNVNMLIKGVNVRKVACVAQVKPSLSPGPVTQQIGRGTRLSPETGKENCLVLQFNFNTGEKHRLSSIIDSILDGADDPDEKVSEKEKARRARIRDRTDHILKTREELDLIKAYELAQKQLLAEDEAERQRKLMAKRAKYEKVQGATESYVYDPLAGLDKKTEARDSSAVREPATPDQIARIKELSKGVVPGHRLTRAAADERIRQLEIRKQYNYASEPQLKLMINLLHCDPKQANKMKSWDARKWIDNTRLSMIEDLISERGMDPIALSEKKVWEIARLHERVLGRKVPVAQDVEVPPETGAGELPYDFSEGF
jgi:superfamily II DNA or RNA helicase